MHLAFSGYHSTLLNIVKHRLQACSRPAARTVTIHQIHFLNILPFLAHSDAFVPPRHRGHVLLGDAACCPLSGIVADR